MQQSNKYIILMGIFTGCLSFIYFLSLFVQVPFIVTILVIIAALFYLYKWVIIDPHKGKDSPKISWLAILLLMAAIYLISHSAYTMAKKYGEWDAWAIWNLDAKYLADPLNWRKLFQNVEYSHPDYPLCLPSVIGFFMRLFSNHFTTIIPFVFSLLITICIPVLIYGEFSNKNIVAGAATLIVFTQCNFYVMAGVLQYADLLLAFFFLCSFICINYIPEGKKYIILSVFFLGCCAWTKNEGIILAFIFLLFYAPVLFSKENIKYSMGAMVIPIVIILLFKITSDTSNDLLNESGNQTFGLLFQNERYMTTYNSFISNVNEKFFYVKIGFYIYIILCIVEKKLPGRQMLVLLTCLVAYFLVYIITPKPLEWQLHTSQDRLLFQLMPAMIYVLALKISGIPFLRYLDMIKRRKNPAFIQPEDGRGNTSEKSSNENFKGAKAVPGKTHINKRR